jgi:hypothetical protein
MNLSWYVGRLWRMRPKELALRLRDEGVKIQWRRLKGRPARIRPHVLVSSPAFAPAIPRLTATVRDTIVASADGMLSGRLTNFGREIPLPREAKDWFQERQSGVLAPSALYAFDIDMRNPEIVGNHKYLLEPSRLQHLPLLAAAFFLSGREAYAELAAAQLQSWWRANPFLVGTHWASGIEVGLRLVSLAWTRRLLDAWPGVGDCFEASSLARDQIYHHQLYLAKLQSHGSSANNHLLAELLGLFVGATAFPWFPESRRWSAAAARGLETEAVRQVFPDGLSREQASEYHGFVLELLLVGAVEGLLAGRDMSPDYHGAIVRMADAWAALLDCRSRPPRQGDSDDGQVLQLDSPELSRRAVSLLAASDALIGRQSWWPDFAEDFRSCLFAELRSSRPGAVPNHIIRPDRRPNVFRDAGLTILRDLEPREDELWCRCDHGPHGYLSIAAHAHADALSVELRHGGVDILADPGTYCYGTEPDFRRFFRSTIGHNTLEIGGANQARFGGPFLWLDAPESTLLAVEGLDGGPVASLTASHKGYVRQSGGPVHARTVILDRVDRRLRIIDRVEASGEIRIRLAFHLGPTVTASLDGNTACLTWPQGDDRRRGRIVLPGRLIWRAFRGSINPICGWYSPAFGGRVPATSLIGEGMLSSDGALETIMEIAPERPLGHPS